MIGIFDSGVGGLSVFREIKKTLPDESYIYYSDNANCPYGEKPKEFIIKRAKEITEFLLSQGAEIIVVPEIEFNLEEIVGKIRRSRANGKHSNIVVVAEGVMSAEKFAQQLQSVTEYSVRPTCIGHVQRGGSPSMADRMLAAQFGNKAVRLLNEGIGNRVVGTRDNKIIDMDIIEAVSMKKTFNHELYETLQMISM